MSSALRNALPTRIAELPRSWADSRAFKVHNPVLGQSTRLELLFDRHQQLLTPGEVLGLAGLSQVDAQRRDLPRAEACAAALKLVHLRSEELKGDVHQPQRARLRRIRCAVRRRAITRVASLTTLAQASSGRRRVHGAGRHSALAPSALAVARNKLPAPVRQYDVRCVCLVQPLRGLYSSWIAFAPH